jgi:hypothetical protein
MTTAGIIFMILAMGAIAILTFISFYKILSSKKK